MSTATRRAILLAGGRGTRLRPFTAMLPKPLVPVGDVPIVEILIRQLQRAGFTDLVLAVGYLGELIEAYFHGGRSEDLGVRLSFVREREPLGTAGCLALVPDLDHTFLVVNADLLTTFDFRGFVAHHQTRGADMTIAATERRERLEWGELEATPGGRLTAYIEKPERTSWVSMGIYACEPSVLGSMNRGEPLDIPDLATRLLADGRVVEVFRSDDYWLDLGSPQDYSRANREFSDRRDEILGADKP